MNIALGAVIIFILLIPPIAFYVSYSFGDQPKASSKFSFLDGVLASAIFSLFIHALAIFILRQEIRFDILLKTVGGEIKDLEQKISNQHFTRAVQQFAFYNFVVLLLAISAGRLCRWIVNRFDVHHNSELFRLYNKWWYLFNGYYLTEIGWETREFDIVFVDALIDTKDASYIYSGYLVEYICKGDELDRIYLNDTQRRIVKVQEASDAINKEEYLDRVGIQGEIFSIAYKDIKNLNLKFISLDNTIDEIEGLPDDGEEGEGD